MTNVPLAAETLRNFLGGVGLGTYLLLAEGVAEHDALAAEAPLIYVFSPLVGSPLTTSAKFAVVSKSPLTERINDSLASSAFAIAGKKCGCDAIVVVGRAAAPSVAVIEDDQLRIEPAGDVWGLSSRATEDALRERLGGDYQIASIGPAGERQVHYATISHDGRHAGRGGSGAVMGAKQLKAIAVRGTRRVAWHDSKALIALSKDLSQRSFGPATAKYRELGTASNLLTFNRLGTLPTRNFQQATFEHAAAISPEQLTATREKTRASCAACTIGCEHIYAFGGSGASSDGLLQKDAGVRLEYENLFALGSLCGVSDPDQVLAASRRCDELGLDTISAGGTIAFAAECVERGLLDVPWLVFGDGDAVLRALDEIVAGTPLGQQLALGSRRLAEQIGHDAIDFAPQVKGLEIPGYEPRTLQTMALGFAVGTRGADHNRSSAYEVDFSEAVDRRDVQPHEARLAVDIENRAALLDSLVLCKFLRRALEDFYGEAAEMLQAVTGWDITAAELEATAARIVAAKKLFNIRAGWRPEEDTLPRRFLEQPLPDDEQTTLGAERLAQLVTAYNSARGWTSEGWIEPVQQASLGLSEL
ncbi:MAG: aldehyde:ferredoxin oxidoreductase [Planctomycetota bacterium]|nr:MAG: aldehyde:ferredoxin oxidoreductase [Planctomycetota bacterium]REK43400.1 MAG: aldehyde:ferredoxin oxidoreductase [Planctomycetota bacterium]